jgi:CheY-like chemotaxis protein
VKVLVVDDEPLARLVLQAAVERLGHQWSAATDGESAWREFTDDQPDVLITDLLMPGMDGLELCRRVRRHAAAHGGYTYVILATVLGDREDVVRGMEVRGRLPRQADGVLQPPVQVDRGAAGDRPCRAGQLPRRAVAAGAHRPAHPAREPVVDGGGAHGARRPRAALRPPLLPGDVRRRPVQDLQRHPRAPCRRRGPAGGGRQDEAGGQVAAYTPGDPTSLEELLEQADAALYRAKSAGRNRVALFEDDLKVAG